MVALLEKREGERFVTLKGEEFPSGERKSILGNRAVLKL